MKVTAAQSWRRGFTLVELLVVIAIIGVLAALITAAANYARISAQEAAMAIELNNLTQAVEAYKLAHKDYPPDFSDQASDWARVKAHINFVYQRHGEDLNKSSPNYWFAQTINGRKPANLDPAEALVFWLSLVKENKEYPLTGTGEAKEFYDFDETRLVDVDQDGWPEYVSKYTKGTPYVYFNWNTYASQGFDGKWGVAGMDDDSDGQTDNATEAGWPGSDDGAVYPPVPPSPQPTSTISGKARPYRSNITGTPPGPTKWINEKSFQIICAGRDGDYGADNPDKRFPSGMNYNIEDRDNIANFSDGTFEDKLP
jgi:prepilin-type N-terminal cleavage/methylation domain-containing protein